MRGGVCHATQDAAAPDAPPHHPVTAAPAGESVPQPDAPGSWRAAGGGRDRWRHSSEEQHHAPPPGGIISGGGGGGGGGPGVGGGDRWGSTLSAVEKAYRHTPAGGGAPRVGTGFRWKEEYYKDHTGGGRQGNPGVDYNSSSSG